MMSALRGKTFHILKNRRAVGRVMHHREVEATFRTRMRQRLLLLMQLVRYVLDEGTTRTDADQASILQLEIGDDVFHNGAASYGPGFGLLVVVVHVPGNQGFEAGPQADLVVPARVLWMDPPRQVQKPRQRLQLRADFRKEQLELRVAVRTGEPNSLHTLINSHSFFSLLD